MIQDAHYGLIARYDVTKMGMRAATVYISNFNYRTMSQYQKISGLNNDGYRLVRGIEAVPSSTLAEVSGREGILLMQAEVVLKQLISDKMVKPIAI